VRRYMRGALEASDGRSILIEKYLMGKECEVDAVADGEAVLIPGVMEHIERAGVHSGDSMAVYPALNLTPKEIDTIVDYTIRIAMGLKVKGLLNVQFVIMRTDGRSQVYVLEVNPRSSRTVPFISKVTGVPLVKLATHVMIGKTLKEMGYSGGLWKKQRLVAVKAPVFSMSKLPAVDTYLGPEMKSTGEVMGVDHTFQGALVKALLASGLMLPAKGGVLLSVADRDKPEAQPIIRKLSESGYRLYATEGTAAMLLRMGLNCTMITKKLGEGHPNVVDVIRNGTVDAAINTISGGGTGPIADGFAIRRAAAERRIPCFTSLDTARVAADALDNHEPYQVRPLLEYLRPPERAK
ncbi:MAG: ATP-grasp domain-containing protein, partial [Chloroflexi bacterium]|nr:ATP-grasp domain-containing protein [Chloroflexota bacterium]